MGTGTIAAMIFTLCFVIFAQSAAANVMREEGRWRNPSKNWEFTVVVTGIVLAILHMLYLLRSIGGPSPSA